jgi:hypothetical protein
MLGLTQLIRFLVVNLTHANLNFRFDICIIFMTNILLMVGGIFIDGDALLMTDFINLKIKLIWSFKGVIEVKYTCVLIRVS